MGTRFFSRVKLNNEINAFAQDGCFTGILENISLGGLFIKTNKRINVGDEIEINLPLRNEFTLANITARLIAIRSESEGVAFTYNNFDHNMFWTLQSFIKTAHVH